MGNRYSESKAIQTHKAPATVGAAGSVTSSWYTTDEFAFLSVNFANASPVKGSAKVHFSFDKVKIASTENIIADDTEQYKTGSTRVKAPYFRIYARNDDTVSRVIEIWAYLND